jgi:hypothetical protein
MIGKSFKGNGFYGTYRYLLETGEPSPQKHAHIIGGNMAGRTAQELSSEVRPSRQLRPDIRKPMWHVSLSFRPGETVTDALMQQASDRFLDEMGLERDQHQHLYIRHHDRPHPHVHLVVNRIRDDGQVHHLHHDYRRIQHTTRKLEQELGLQPTHPHRQTHLKTHIDRTAQRHPTLSAFCHQLQQHGIHPQFTQRRGQLSGLSYHYQGQRIRGSRLGKAYSFQGLQRHHGIDYQPQRDDPHLHPTYLEPPKPTSTPAPSPDPELPPQPTAAVAHLLNHLLNQIGQDHYSGARYHTQRQQQRLILRRQQSQETLLDATWNPQQQRWQPNQPGRLRASDLSHLRRSAQTLQAEEQRQRQQRQRQLTREPELEL